MTPRRLWFVVALAAVALLGGAAEFSALMAFRSSAATQPRRATPPAIEALARLSVAAEANATTYRRAKFGAPWADVDHNGCDTRDDILKRDLVNVATAKTRACPTTVVVGDLLDPYTGIAVHFTKSDAIAVQIDHIVSLGEAWRSGASAWDNARRLAYANDPQVLQATTQAANDAKSDHDAAQPWRQCASHGPSGRCTGWQDDRPIGQRACAYALHVVQIKSAYGLTVDRAERDVLAADLQGCDP